MLCSDVMKKNVECLDKRDSVQTAARRMRERNIGFIPVCDEARKVVGTITDRDLAVRVLADGRGANTTLEQVMSTELVACRPKDELRRAQEVMAKRQKSRILCVDEEGHAVGVISLSDIVEKSQGDGVIQTMRRITAREARP
jgi:CBS domain-containing protein